MNRPLIFLAAMATAAAAVTSACLAEVRNSDRPFRADDLHFTLTDKDAARGMANFHLTQGRDHDRINMSNDTRLADLGLAPTALDRDGSIVIAMVRDAGRIDCNGTVRGGRAEGNCRFAADTGFNALLAQTGVARPDLEDSYGMTILGVTRAMVDAVRDSKFGPATPDDLTAMAAVGVTPAYIRELASRGYRPSKIDDLVAFKAVGVTGDYVDGLTRAGVKTSDGETVVAMRALGITPEFVSSFARIGYPNLDPDKLVELKALGITPAMVQAVERDRSALSLPQRAAARSLVDSRR